MKPILAIMRSDGNTTHTVAFDRETVEFARLNRKVQERRNAYETEAERRRRKAKRKAEFEWYTTKTMGYITARSAVLVILGISISDGLMEPVMGIIPGVYCIASALIRIGKWISEGSKL